MKVWDRLRGRGGPAQIYVDLRRQLLTIDPAEVGIEPSAGDEAAEGEGPAHVWLVLMEFGIEGGAATIVSLADGTTSMYSSTGGGTIGGGEHESIAAATRRFIEVADEYAGPIERFAPTNEFPLPEEGHVRFNLRTFDGGLTAEARIDQIEAGGHPLEPLYAAGQDVITEFRLVDERGGLRQT